MFYLKIIWIQNRIYVLYTFLLLDSENEYLLKVMQLKVKNDKNKYLKYNNFNKNNYDNSKIIKS